ncbi:hypothetical protein MKW98_026244 [Papaver atlanticum]|uniref:RING-type domain-containing protein n=1 Tax=Papaver atlanticum TaxID=357466 RepID=A0AAD4SQ60_9MAGN|nr:hypothetical protein MKW98_026244 [Papaver atlanticum]
MNDSQSGGGKWKFLKGKLGLKSMTCCSGGIWGLGAASSNMRVREEEEEDDLEMQLTEHIVDVGSTNGTTTAGRDCVPRSASGINLAMALAAERHYRAAQEYEVGPTSSSSRSTSNNTITTGTPMRVSLMRLLEEGDGIDFDEDDDEDEETEKGNDKKGGLGSDVMCCVCMRRKKGAAFIPCGHTFCRVCSRELWLNRGSCPLCNRSILEILDIF